MTTGHLLDPDGVKALKSFLFFLASSSVVLEPFSTHTIQYKFFMAQSLDRFIFDGVNQLAASFIFLQAEVPQNNLLS